MLCSSGSSPDPGIHHIYLKDMAMSHKLYWNHKQGRDDAIISYFYSCATGNKFGQLV